MAPGVFVRGVMLHSLLATAGSGAGSLSHRWSQRRCLCPGDLASEAVMLVAPSLSALSLRLSADLVHALANGSA